MSVCGTPLVKGADLRAELATLPLPERVRRIEGKLAETTGALAARNEKLLKLRVDFAALTLDFWKAFARSLGCENPAETIKTEDALLIGRIVGIVTLIVCFVLLSQVHGASPAAAGTVCLLGIVVLLAMIYPPLSRIACARQMADVLARQQTPIWLTGGAIGLSDPGTIRPAEAKWWWKDRIVFVFVRHVAVRFSVDALSFEPVWEDLSWTPAGPELSARSASEILRHLITTTPRYRQLVNSFSSLASLDTDHKELLCLRAEAEQDLAAEKEHAAALREKAQPQITEAARLRLNGQTGCDHWADNLRLQRPPGRR